MTFALDKYLKFLPASAAVVAVEFLSGVASCVICGQIIGEDGLSALNLMQPVANAVTFLALLAGIGTSVLFATEMGRFDKRRASEYATQGLWTVLILGSLSMLVLALVRHFAAGAFGVTGAVLVGLKEYWLWFLPCALLEPLSVYLSSLCYADGDPKTCIGAYIVQFAATCAFSVWLTLRMGFAGCALGTIIGHVLAVAVLCMHFVRKENNIEYAWHFSVCDSWSICRCAIGDASSRIFEGALILALNLYVVARFGEGMLPVLSVAVVVLSAVEFFDGVPRAMQPLVSVYVGEGNDRLVFRVLRYAEILAFAEGAALALLLILFPQFAVSMVGITDPGLVGEAMTAVRIVAAGLVGLAFMALFNSYWTYIAKESLALALTACTMFVAPVVLFVAFGEVFGVVGVWAALAIAPFAAIGAFAFFICAKWGRKELPHFLDWRRAARIRVFDLVLSPKAICGVSEKIRKFLAIRRGFGRAKADLTALLVEETLMLVKDHNKGRKTRAEISLDFSRSDELRLIVRDDGEIFNLTDTDAEVSSLRAYLVSNLMVFLPAKRNMTITGFNRNIFQI
ncbi:MAG: hypothetical protein II909_00250 [Kiritimatiellae bacterium]|nr:hypothetical protein [Kiritimatiellia bacterium]